MFRASYMPSDSASAEPCDRSFLARSDPSKGLHKRFRTVYGNSIPVLTGSLLGSSCIHLSFATAYNIVRILVCLKEISLVT
ncbi:hypothetical protein NL676_028693 [Syzygium grande]|nr:hypothetical protein NL676_028693 [Syzygium grande]